MSELLLSYRYILVFFGSIFEGDATLLGAAFLAHRHVVSLAAVIATAILASTAWNELVFYFSRKGGRGFLEKRVAQHPRYDRVQRWVRRRSVILLLFSRYLFGFRLAIPVACGATGMCASTFTVVNVVEERAESLSLVPDRCLSHALQRTGHAHFPALCPARVLLKHVLLGQPPSLRHLRCECTRFVRWLRR